MEGKRQAEIIPFRLKSRADSEGVHGSIYGQHFYNHLASIRYILSHEYPRIENTIRFISHWIRCVAIDHWRVADWCRKLHRGVLDVPPRSGKTVDAVNAIHADDKPAQKM